MYEILPETRPGLMALKVSGKIARADYESLSPWLDSQIALRNKPSALIVIENFGGFDGLDAVAEDIRLGVKHYTDLGKVAVVGDRNWQEIAVKLFAPLAGLEVKYFEHGDLEQARAWLAG